VGGAIVDIRWRGRELQHTPEINKTAAHPAARGPRKTCQELSFLRRQESRRMDARLRGHDNLFVHPAARERFKYGEERLKLISRLSGNHLLATALKKV